jgi:nucleoside-diphosphate-sugar epimerase
VTLVGGAGFIGHHLALALAREGARVSIIDGLQVNNLLAFASADHDVCNQSLNLRIISERLELLKQAGVPLYIMDARDERALANRLDQLRPQVLIHLAGVAHAQQSNLDPRSAFEHTLRTLQYSLECVRGSIEHFIYFSSSMVYGHFDDGAVTEESPCRPVGIYGALKYSGEKMVIAHQQVFDVPYTIVRPSALYGPRCVSRRVVQVFLENALFDRPFVVHGDGSDRLDFTYIADLVDGILGIIRRASGRNETFNLTYGKSRSINELIGLLRAHFPGIEVEHKTRGKLVPERGTLCVDKARAMIGYRPRWALEEGMAAYLQWYRSMSCPDRAWAGHEAEPAEAGLELSVPSPA